MAKAGSAAQAIHSGRKVIVSTMGVNVTMPAATPEIATAMSKRQPAAADEKAAQQGKLLMLGIFRDEALRRRAQPRSTDAADQQQPGPGINVNAEFVTAEPARQQICATKARNAATMRMMKAVPARRRISEESPPPANNARPRAIAP